ncbi:hypothetical protein TRAPUB_12482 [Trametes pubescens]|uniref:Uncharacterized protein n=1 Tax=Trametes pubescens TaxID=154538 RepID=A0A1M2VTR6_TRAPU|nr:hypothetical protein TRAPUB_12482 [Trametes pubescens]
MANTIDATNVTDTTNTTVPSTENLITPDGISLFDLQFNNIGVSLLRMYLGEGLVYEWFKAHFDATDMAWFLAGLHKDGRHDILPNS